MVLFHLFIYFLILFDCLFVFQTSARAAKNYNDPRIIRHVRNEERELEPKCVAQLFLGLFWRMRWSAIGQFFPLSLVTIPEVSAKVNSAQFPSRFESSEFL